MQHVADQPNLFEEKAPRVEMKPAQQAEIAAVVETLLREIAATLVNTANGESSHEQDNG